MSRGIEAPRIHHHEFLPTAVRATVEEHPYAKFGNRMAELTRKVPLINGKGIQESARETQQRIDIEVARIIQESMSDLDPHSVEAKRITAMAPALFDAVVKTPQIAAVSERHLGDAIRWSIESARNPLLITRTTLRVGFGGTDDDSLSMRFPAYAVPALTMWQRLNAVRQQREVEVTTIIEDRFFREMATREGLLVDQKQLSEQERQYIKNRKATLREQVSIMARTYKPDTDELASLREQAGCFEMPQIEFFFAPHAGIEVNDKNAQRVHRNVQQSQELLQAFTERFYPEAQQHVRFKTDRPWREHGPFTQTINRYLHTLVKTHPHLEEVMNKLSELGAHHGEEQGRELASVYAALHPLFFQDRVTLPVFNVIDRNHQELASITIGGMPERLFNEARQILSEIATPKDFMKFAEQDQKLSARHYDLLRMWVNSYYDRQANYNGHGLETRWARADRPLLTLPLVTKVGRHPVYYLTEFDIPLTDEHVLAAQHRGLTEHTKRIANEAVPGEGTPEQKNKLKAVSSDLQTLCDATGGADNLLAFYEDFLSGNR